MTSLKSESGAPWCSGESNARFPDAFCHPRVSAPRHRRILAAVGPSALAWQHSTGKPVGQWMLLDYENDCSNSARVGLLGGDATKSLSIAKWIPTDRYK